MKKNFENVFDLNLSFLSQNRRKKFLNCFHQKKRGRPKEFSAPLCGAFGYLRRRRGMSKIQTRPLFLFFFMSSARLRTI